MVTKKKKQQRPPPSQIPLPISPTSPGKSHDLASANLQQSDAVTIINLQLDAVKLADIE